MMVHHKAQRYYAALVVWVLLICLTGCSTSPPSETNTRQMLDGKIPVLTVGTTMQVNNINIEDYYFGILRAIFTHKGLIKLDEQGEFTGDLAENWQSADGKVWIFTLRQGLTWHDGEPVTAQDVKFTIEYNIAKNVEYRSHFSLIRTVAAPDEQTLVITLSQSNPRFLVSLLVLRTLPRHIFANVDNPAAFNDPKAAIGCGPYQFVKFDRNAGMILFKSNDRYYRGAPLVQEIKIRLFKNPDTLYMALQKGEIDLPYTYAAGVDPVYVTGLAKNNRIALLNIPNLGVSKALIFNAAKAPVQDPRVRTALSYAIDYQELVRLFPPRSGSVPTAGFVPRDTAGFIETRPLEFNSAKAKQLLAEAGYLPGPTGIRKKNGAPLVFELLIRNDIAENIRLGELLQKYFSDTGVELRLRTVDATLFRTISDKEKSYASLLSRTTPWGMMMWAGMGSGYIDDRNIGWAMASDPQLHTIVDRMNSAQTSADYRRNAAELQQYYADTIPAIALYWDHFIQPCNAGLTGWKISPMYGVLNEDTWYNLRKVTP